MYKIWNVLFTCLVTRAICLIIVPDRTTVTFLRALRELSVRYCEPRIMVSDNEGSFMKADRVLNELSLNPVVKKTLGTRGVTWKFLPSRASWMGGVWERLVGLVKIELMKLQSKAKFDEYEWRAHLLEVEAVLNDRPLTYVSDVGTEPEVITPKAIMHGCLSDTALVTDINVD